jgi:group I intron endonuclease
VIISPSGRIYVGSSKDIGIRFNHYRLLLCKEQPKLYRSFVKYGIDNHLFVVIKECHVDDLNLFEFLTGYDLDVLRDGLNCVIPNPNTTVSCVSKSTREKISAAQKGKRRVPLSPESRAKISEALRGRPLSAEHRIKLSNIAKASNRRPPTSDEIKRKIIIKNTGLKRGDQARLNISRGLAGRSLDESHKKNISNARIGHKQTKEAIEKSSNTRKKIILNTLSGVYFFGIKEAAETHSINRNYLGTMLNGAHPNLTNLIYV